MILEAGLKKDDENKAKHRTLSSNISAHYARYEHWVKRIGSIFILVWITFVLIYWHTNGSLSAPSGAALADAEVSGVRGANLLLGSTTSTFPLETHFLVMGDYGTGDANQSKVAEALKRHASTLEPKPAFVISTGDQIYDHGLVSVNDPVLSTRFEKMYAHPDLRIPWFVTIGNHDCEGSISAMLQYANQPSSLWYMPRRYYTADVPVAPKTILRLVVLDACDLVCGHEPRNWRCTDTMNAQSSSRTRNEQYQWINDVLSAGKPTGIERMWTVVVGHWAVYSFAGNADTPELIRGLDPLLQRHRVHAYFNGHDHCMQHIKKYENGWARNYFVSGAGGYRIHELEAKARASPDLVHAAMTHGFMSVRMTKDLFRVQLVDKQGDVLYTTDVQYQ